MFIASSIRASFGFTNPNAAAALIASLLVACWTFESVANPPLRRRLPLWVLELLLVVALGMTGSRAGLLAAAGSLILFQGLLVRHRLTSWTDGTLRVIARLGLGMICSFATQVGPRIQRAVEGDESISNRLELWAGGLRLIHASPFSGWGRGTSGQAFMHWLQAPSAAPKYGGMVNSFLHLAVEFGLPTLALALTLCLFPLISATRRGAETSTPRRILQIGCAALLAGAALANACSTLWLHPGAVALPLATLLLAVSLEKERLKTYGLSLGGAGAATLALYACTVWFERRATWKLDLNPDRTITLRREGGSGKTVVLLPDQRVLGPAYGKELRSAVTDQPSGISRVVICPPGVSYPSTHYNEVLSIWFGARAPEAAASRNGARAVLFYPAGSSHRLNGNALLVLPSIDEDGIGSEWRSETSRPGQLAWAIDQSGQDGRSDWPDTWQRILAWSGLQH